jgi:hypothetical protein
VERVAQTRRRYAGERKGKAQSRRSSPDNKMIEMDGELRHSS